MPIQPVILAKDKENIGQLLSLAPPDLPPKKRPTKPWPPLPVFSSKQTRHANDQPVSAIATI